MTVRSAIVTPINRSEPLVNRHRPPRHGYTLRRDVRPGLGQVSLRDGFKRRKGRPSTIGFDRAFVGKAGSGLGRHAHPGLSMAPGADGGRSILGCGGVKAAGTGEVTGTTKARSVSGHL